MLKKNVFIAGLTLTAMLFATESRIESMGKRDLFFRDDMSIFYNPANISVLGNFVTGSMGFVRDSSYVTVDELRKDSTTYLDTAETSKTVTPSNQWFGVVYNKKIGADMSVFGGLAFNRVDQILSFYNNARQLSRKHNNKLPDFPELNGKSDYMLGVRMKTVNIAASLYSASQHFVTSQSDIDVGLSKATVGTEFTLGSNSVEFFGSMGAVSYSYSRGAVSVHKATTDLSVLAGGRAFFQTNLGGGLVFVPAVEYSALNAFGNSRMRAGAGLGVNLRLEGGFFWAGVEGEYYSNVNDSSKNENPESDTTGMGVRFNFGVEKSLIWKWLTVRVGGSKFIAYETVKDESDIEKYQWYENPLDNGQSEDFLGFGVGLNYQNRLRFDITLNEALPYFNPFGDGLANSSNGGHMVLRISSTFSL